MHLQPGNRGLGEHSYPSSHTNHGCLCQAVRLLSEPEGDEQREKEMISRWAGKEGISFLSFFLFLPMVDHCSHSFFTRLSAHHQQRIPNILISLPPGEDVLLDIGRQSSHSGGVCVCVCVLGWGVFLLKQNNNKKNKRCPFYKVHISGRNEVMPGQKG